MINGWFMMLAYLTIFPFFGFLVRLTKFETLNDSLTLFYTFVYWIPYRLVRGAWCWVVDRRHLPVPRNDRIHEVVAQPGFYTLDKEAGIYRSKYNLDATLKEFGSVEYWPIVYNSISHPMNGSFNFRRQLFPFAENLILTTNQSDSFRVLDIGSGPGNSTAHLTEMFKNSSFFCLDISEKLLERAKRKCPEAYFFKGTMEDTGFRDEVFNIIYCVGGINETDVDMSMREIWRIAKPNSLIVILDENFDAKAWWHKMAIVLVMNLHYMISYKYDGSPSRMPTNAKEVLGNFFEKEMKGRCEVLLRYHAQGVAFGFVVRKIS